MPVFYRPPSAERDATIMRTNNETDGACLQVQRQLANSSSADYLIPIPSSNYSLNTEKTELHSPSSVESMEKLLQLEEPVKRNTVEAQSQRNPICWETSFNADDSSNQPMDSIPTPPPPPRSSIMPNAVRSRRSEGYVKIPNHDNEIEESLLPTNPMSYARNDKSPNPSCNSICYSSSPNKTHENSNKDLNGSDGLSSLISLDEVSMPLVSKPSAIVKCKKLDESKKLSAPTEQRQSSLSLDASALYRQANGQPPVPYVNVPISQSGRSNLPLVRALSCDRYSTNSLQHKNQLDRLSQPSPSIIRGQRDNEVNC